MDRSECMHEVGRLFSAFPQRTHSEATANTYVEALVGLQYAGALHDAVDDLIDNERWLPPIALIKEVYARKRENHLPPALPEAELTEEQRAENVKRAAELLARLKGEPDL